MQPIFLFFFERESERDNVKCDHVLSVLFGDHLPIFDLVWKVH
jgi:hypothetical protein